MKKQTIYIIILLVFIVGAGVYFYCSQTVSQKVADTNPVVVQRVVANLPATTTPVVASDPLLGIDYSSLEKDRLYTEEEGKYVNLSEVGQKLLRAVSALPECVQNPNLSNCYEYRELIKNGSSIIALNEGFLLFSVPNGKGGSGYGIYDLKQRKVFHNSYWGYWGTQVRNDKFVVLVKNKSDKTQSLIYYKLGMSTFAPVPKSEIPPTESYWYYGDMGSEILKTTFKENVLRITVFNEWKGEIGITIPKKLREATFDLNTLK